MICTFLLLYAFVSFSIFRLASLFSKTKYQCNNFAKPCIHKKNKFYLVFNTFQRSFIIISTIQYFKAVSYHNNKAVLSRKKRKLVTLHTVYRKSENIMNTVLLQT